MQHAAVGRDDPVAFYRERIEARTFGDVAIMIQQCDGFKPVVLGFEYTGCQVTPVVVLPAE